MKIFSTGVMCEGVYEYDSPFVPDRLWSNYSRAKSMILLCEDQEERHRLHIDDRFPAYPYEVGTQENDGWYAANSSKSAYILRPGKYELSIDEIYRGEVSDTVGLSRIWFYPISQSLIDMLDADSQSDMALFDRLPLLISDIVYSYETPKFGDHTDNDESKNYASETELTSDDDDYAGQEGKSIWLYICILSGILVGVVLFFSKRKNRE